MPKAHTAAHNGVPAHVPRQLLLLLLLLHVQLLVLVVRCPNACGGSFGFRV